MNVIDFPRAPIRRHVRYPTIREQIVGLQRDLAAAAALTTDQRAAHEFIITVKRLTNLMQRMEMGR